MSSLMFGWLTRALIIASLSVASVCAQQLPIRQYGVSDGLVNGEITSIYQDAKGYLWFSTFEGVSRFDGYRFVNYDADDGLPQASINHITADREGRLWVATNEGVARLQDDPRQEPAPSGAAPAPRTKFISFKVSDSKYANQVNRIHFDTQNRLWCLTDLGLYHATFVDDRFITETILVGLSFPAYASLEDRRGRLWFGAGTEELRWRNLSQGRCCNSTYQGFRRTYSSEFGC